MMQILPVYICASALISMLLRSSYTMVKNLVLWELATFSQKYLRDYLERTKEFSDHVNQNFSMQGSVSEIVLVQARSSYQPTELRSAPSIRAELVNVAHGQKKTS